MRFPAVAIATAFALGVAIELWLSLGSDGGFRTVLMTVLPGAALCLLGSGILLIRQKLLLASLLSLVAWASLGLAAATIANQPDPENHIQRLVAKDAVELRTPLRWHGILRDEPATLPWGSAFDMTLYAVEYGGQSITTQGGLRVGFSPRAGEAPLPQIHAGDDVAVITQARLPQLFRDEGAFDRRAYLRAQGVDLTATLRAPELLERNSEAKSSPSTFLAKLRRRFRESLSALLPAAPREAAVLRAMLLGDRSFLDRAESVNFQKTGVFHVLAVAGLHVGAFAAFLFWSARKMRLPRGWTALAVGGCILAYLAVVEQRPPVLRAALMTFVVLAALFFFRRVELLNSVAIAALILLVARPKLVADSSFQLSFLSLFCIAAIAAPWIEAHLEPFIRSLRGWRDVTRDISHRPRIAQFRIDLRSIASWVDSKLPARLARSGVAFSIYLMGLAFRVSELLALTLVLQVGMLPLLARDFHRITISGVLANLIAVPLTGILVPLGFATLISAAIFQRAGLLLAIPLRWLTTLLLFVVDRIAALPRWSYHVPDPRWWLVGGVLLCIVVLAVAIRFASPRAAWLKRAAFAGVVAGTFLIAICPFAPRWQRGFLEFTTLDVGQGDSLLVVSPGGHTILVDGGGSFVDPARHDETRGPDPGEDAVSPYLWSRGFKKLDVVALTHAHQDHLGGLVAVLNNFEVQTLWIGREVDSTQQRQLETLAASHGTRVVHQMRGERIDWDGAVADVLWPQIVPGEIAPAARNDDSLIIKLNIGRRSLLLPGDAEKAVESALVAESGATALQSDVLKVGHHGSKNSTTPEFLAAVAPRLAVISSGAENPYGHPSAQLLQRLDQAGVPYLRTDTNGAIHILTDGSSMQVGCFVPCEEISRRLSSSRPQEPDQQQQPKQQ